MSMPIRSVLGKLFIVLLVGNVAAYLVYVFYPRIVYDGANLGKSFYRKFAETTVDEYPTTNVTVEAGRKNGNDSIESDTVSSDFLLDCGGVCSNGTGLVIIVTTAVSNTARRTAIRNTWASPSVLNSASIRTRLCFIVGTVSNDNLTKSLLDESRTHGDIIQGNFVDTYRNLTLKSLSLLKWVDAFCPSVKYVVKTDDDTYFNIPMFLSEVGKINADKRSFFFCYVHSLVNVIRTQTNKWYVSKNEFAGRVYPPYCAGSSYALTGNLVHDLIEKSRQIPVFWLEDVYITGVLPREIKGCTHMPTNRIHFSRERPDPCAWRQLIASHRVTAEEFLDTWAKLKDPNLLCKR